MFSRPLVLFQIFILYYVAVHTKTPKSSVAYEHKMPNSKHANPNFVNDRPREISKPQMPKAWKERNWKPFHPAWMDYCDQYHCADYHKPACGLNRDSMRFKWFQSQCHIIINNQCAYFRGLLKYDIVDVKFCGLYAMQLRSGCPEHCDLQGAPVCARGRSTQPVLFRNHCELERANCNNFLQEYHEVQMRVCEDYWHKQ